MGDRIAAVIAPGWVRTLGAVVVLIAARTIATMLAQRWGFHALSDDDFARITIAQAFAREPHLDPTGTSWLPLPFWTEGAAMMLFGRSLVVAHAFAATLSASCTVVLYAAARVVGVRPGAALLSALICTLMPIALLVGAAPVPDLGVAMLCASALILLRARDPRWRIVSGALILVATLCRYEPWPAAIAIASIAWMPGVDDTAPKPSLRTRAIACGLALAGPCLWIAWNAHAHGDPFHFHARVSAYRSALGVASGGWRALLAGYPSALAVDALPLVVVAWLARASWRLPMPPRATGQQSAPPRATGQQSAPPRATGQQSAPLAWVRPVAGALVMLGALVVADAAGSAPTHHPERALLAMWFVLWTAAIDRVDRVGNGQRLVVLGASIAILGFGIVRVNSIFAGYGVDRQVEVRAGEWLHANTQHEERVLLDPVDYGYFAIMAASARPERVILSRSLDPRAARTASPFESESDLRARMAQDHASWLVASQRNSLRAVAEVRATIGTWEIGRGN